MIRFFGSAALLSAGALLFFRRETERQRRIRQGEELLVGLQQLKSDVRSLHVGLLRELEHLGGFYHTVLAVRELNPELSLPEATERAAGRLPLREREVMIRFGKALAGDEESILAAAENAENELTVLLHELRSAAHEQRKVSAALCFGGSGLLWLIFI